MSNNVLAKKSALHGTSIALFVKWIFWNPSMKKTSVCGTFIMTWETDWKKTRRGRPSSPEMEMAMPRKDFVIWMERETLVKFVTFWFLLWYWKNHQPVTTEKMTRPRMLVELLQEPFIFQLSLVGGGTWTQIKLSICRTLIIEKLMEHQCWSSFFT